MALALSRHSYRELAADGPETKKAQPIRDTLLAAFAGATYQMGACMNLMIQKQTAKLNIAAEIVKPTCLRMRAS